MMAYDDIEIKIYTLDKICTFASSQLYSIRGRSGLKSDRVPNSWRPREKVHRKIFVDHTLV